MESKPRREIDRIRSSRSSRETERVAETERDNLEQGEEARQREGAGVSARRENEGRTHRRSADESQVQVSCQVPLHASLGTALSERE